MKRRDDRDYRWLATSVALHVVAIALLLRVVIVPGTFSTLFRETPQIIPPSPEKLYYVPLPRGDSTRAQIDGGDDRPADPKVAIAPMLRAPVRLPDGLPPAPKIGVVPGEPGGSGPLIGGGGPLRGVQPSFGDGRLWPAPGPLLAAPKTDDERRDSVLASRLSQYRDSLNLAERGQVGPGERPSWTFDHNGEQYGIDRNKIRLGKFSLPSALLYQLPLARYQGDLSKERARVAMDQEMYDQRRRRMNEEEFRAAVKAIRERKERERREADASKHGSDASPPVSAGTR